MKSKEGLEERLEFLFPDEEERKNVVRSMTNARILNSVINQMGFPGYFLIVMEFIQWSKDNGVPVGPPWLGCGLAGGVCAENYRPRSAGV